MEQLRDRFLNDVMTVIKNYCEATQQKDSIACYILLRVFLEHLPTIFAFLVTNFARALSDGQIYEIFEALIEPVKNDQFAEECKEEPE